MNVIIKSCDHKIERKYYAAKSLLNFHRQFDDQARQWVRRELVHARRFAHARANITCELLMNDKLPNIFWGG